MARILFLVLLAATINMADAVTTAEKEQDSPACAGTSCPAESVGGDEEQYVDENSLLTVMARVRAAVQSTNDAEVTDGETGDASGALTQKNAALTRQGSLTQVKNLAKAAAEEVENEEDDAEEADAQAVLSEDGEVEDGEAEGDEAEGEGQAVDANEGRVGEDEALLARSATNTKSGYRNYCRNGIRREFTDILPDGRRYNKKACCSKTCPFCGGEKCRQKTKSKGWCCPGQITKRKNPECTRTNAVGCVLPDQDLSDRCINGQVDGVKKSITECSASTDGLYPEAYCCRHQFLHGGPPFNQCTEKWIPDTKAWHITVANQELPQHQRQLTFNCGDHYRETISCKDCNRQAPCQNYCR